MVMRLALLMLLMSLVLLGCRAKAELKTPKPQPPAQPTFRDTFSDTWTGVDALGRRLPGFAECGPPRKGRYVGIFYFIWHGDLGGPYDISKILAGNPAHPQWGPPHAFHWWSEPLFGYYQDQDPWVLRKHAQLLSDAGVDVVILDATNGFTYTETYLKLCQVWEALRREGRRTPQIAFITHSGPQRTVQKLWDEFYSKGLYRDLWFYWKGKPLLLAPVKGLAQQFYDFFTVRESWAWHRAGWFGDGKDKWCWLDDCPQKPGWHESPDKPEEVAVCVAQHPISNYGRSYHAGKEPPPDQLQPELGLSFQEQWDHALEVDPEFVFVTGWNEWIAQRFIVKPGQRVGMAGKLLKPGDSYFVDQYSPELSRDVEPMKDGFGDNYYCQLVANIRRYKGVRQAQVATRQYSIEIDGDFRDWAQVEPAYLDDAGDTFHRNYPGCGSAGPYIDTTGRNDIVECKVACDADKLYFYARTAKPLTPPSDPNWMLLFIDVDGKYDTGWEGFDYVVNRTIPSLHQTLLEHSRHGWDWRSVARLDYKVKGNELELAIPRRLLKLEGKSCRFEFKWADNMQSPDALDWYLHGDTAPNARFRYLFQLKED